MATAIVIGLLFFSAIFIIRFPVRLYGEGIQKRAALIAGVSLCVFMAAGYVAEAHDLFWDAIFVCLVGHCVVLWLAAWVLEAQHDRQCQADRESRERYANRECPHSGEQIESLPFVFLRKDGTEIPPGEEE